MPYSQDFFELQLSYAHRLAGKFRRNLGAILYEYTTFSRSPNLVAYRRLYPPGHTRQKVESEAHEFQFLALWGQFFDWNWCVKEHLATELFNRLEALTDLEELRFCFPYQILMSRCHIQVFYDFYGIA